VVANYIGTVEQDLDYTPYGNIITGTPTEHYLFTGKERDSESGLDNFGARYYTSNFGRFITPDWAARPTAVPYAVFGDPQSLNLYTYVRNDPVTLADADGHAENVAPPLDCESGAGCRGDTEKKQNAIGGRTIGTAQKTYTIQVVGADGKRHDMKLAVGSQVLVMKKGKPGLDPRGSGAAALEATYEVYDVSKGGLQRETKPTDVFMQEKATGKTTACDSPCADPQGRAAAQFTDLNSTGTGAPFESRQQFFIGSPKADPALILLPAGRVEDNVFLDAGRSTHVVAYPNQVSIGVVE